MHQKFHPGRNLSSHRLKRQFHPHQYHRLHTGNHIFRTVGVCRSKTSVMTGVPGLQKIHRLLPADLAHDNAIRRHTKRGADQIPDRNLPVSFHIGRFCLQTHQIFHTLDL